MPLAADLRVQTDRVAATGTFWYPRVAHAVMEQNVAVARKSGRPVRIAYSREEEFAGTKPRHAFRTAVSGELVDLLANGLRQVYLALFGIAIVAALLARRLTASMPDHPAPAEVEPMVAPSTAAPGRE